MQIDPQNDHFARLLNEWIDRSIARLTIEHDRFREESHMESLQTTRRDGGGMSESSQVDSTLNKLFTGLKQILNAQCVSDSGKQRDKLGIFYFAKALEDHFLGQQLFASSSPSSLEESGRLSSRMNQQNNGEVEKVRLVEDVRVDLREVRKNEQTKAKRDLRRYLQVKLLKSQTCCVREMVMFFKNLLQNKWKEGGVEDIPGNLAKSMKHCEARVIIFAFHTFSWIITDFIMILLSERNAAYTSQKFGIFQQTYRGIFSGQIVEGILNTPRTKQILDVAYVVSFKYSQSNNLLHSIQQNLTAALSTHVERTRKDSMEMVQLDVVIDSMHDGEEEQRKTVDSVVLSGFSPNSRITVIKSQQQIEKYLTLMRENLGQKMESYLQKAQDMIAHCLDEPSKFKQIKKIFKLMVELHHSFVEYSAASCDDDIGRRERREKAENFVRQPDTLYCFVKIFFLQFLIKNSGQLQKVFALTYNIQFLDDYLKMMTYIDSVRVILTHMVVALQSGCDDEEAARTELYL